MTLNQFNSLTEDEKTAMVWSASEYIGNRTEDNYRALLYQLYSFYVELYYNGEDNKICKVRSFSSTDQLEPYLNNIDIPYIRGVI